MVYPTLLAGIGDVAQPRWRGVGGQAYTAWGATAVARQVHCLRECWPMRSIDQFHFDRGHHPAELENEPMPILRVVPFLLVTATTVAAQSDGNKPGHAGAVIALPGGIKWSPAPAILPKGARLAVIEGDPGKAGEFTMRLWMPPNYRIPPHFHPAAEHITVLQGTFFVGMGDTFDPKRGTSLPVGSFGAMPTGMHHFAWTEGETIIQLHGMGPWKLTYVNPADDPSYKGN